jgi:hypothetical protein
MMKSLRWKEYCEKYKTDSLYFYGSETLCVISEGCGDNLDYEDEEEGYVDYWYCEVYNKTEGNCGGGMLMVKEYIQNKNLTIEETVKYLQENASLFDGLDGIDLMATLVDPELGEELEGIYTDIAAKIFQEKIERRAV